MSTESPSQLQTNSTFISKSQENPPIKVIDHIPLSKTMNKSDQMKIFSHLEKKGIFQVYHKKKRDGRIKTRVISTILPHVPLTYPITDDSYIRQKENVLQKTAKPDSQESVIKECPDVDTPPQLPRNETSFNAESPTYSTLDTPAATTPVQPKPVPTEITFSPHSCMRTPKILEKLTP